MAALDATTSAFLHTQYHKRLRSTHSVVMSRISSQSRAVESVPYSRRSYCCHPKTPDGAGIRDAPNRSSTPSAMADLTVRPAATRETHLSLFRLYPTWSKFFGSVPGVYILSKEEENYPSKTAQELQNMILPARGRIDREPLLSPTSPPPAVKKKREKKGNSQKSPFILLLSSLFLFTKNVKP